MAVSSVVSEIFNVGKCRDLEIWVRGHSGHRYRHISIRTTFRSNHEPFSYRFRDRWRFQSQIAKFSHPLYFASPLKRFPLELGTCAGGQKTNDRATGPRKKFDDIFSRLHTIHQRDGQTDTGRQQRPRVARQKPQIKPRMWRVN